MSRGVCSSSTINTRGAPSGSPAPRRNRCTCGSTTGSWVRPFMLGVRVMS
jgi:hypothetical protein